MFADGSFWTPAPIPAPTTDPPSAYVASGGNNNWINLNPSPAPQPVITRDLLEAFTAGFEITYPSIRIASTSGAEAVISADNADQKLCSMFHMQRAALRMMNVARVRIIGASKAELCNLDLSVP